jgi:hypothetical protein
MAGDNRTFVPNPEQRGPNDSLKLIFAVSDRDMLRDTHRAVLEVLQKLDAMERRVMKLEQIQHQNRGALRLMKVFWGVLVAAIMAYFGWRQSGHH